MLIHSMGIILSTGIIRIVVRLLKIVIHVIHEVIHGCGYSWITNKWLSKAKK